MARTKLRLELIQNQKSRRKTFETRKKGLERKAEELSTLCEVDLCMIVYSDEGTEPIIWPRNRDDQVSAMIESFKLSKSRNEFTGRESNLDSYLRERTGMVEAEINKVRKKIRAANYPNGDEMCNRMSLDELKDFVRVLTGKIDGAKSRINSLKELRKNGESCSGVNPMMQEPFLPGVMDMGFDSEKPLGWYDAQCAFTQESQRRMLMMAERENNPFNFEVNSGGSCSWVNPMMQEPFLPRVMDMGFDPPLGCYEAQCSLNQESELRMSMMAEQTNNPFNLEVNREEFAPIILGANQNLASFGCTTDETMGLPDFDFDFPSFDGANQNQNLYDFGSGTGHQIIMANHAQYPSSSSSTICDFTENHPQLIYGVAQKMVTINNASCLSNVESSPSYHFTPSPQNLGQELIFSPGMDCSTTTSHHVQGGYSNNIIDMWDFGN